MRTWLTLFAWAVATRAGITGPPCPYCGDRSTPTRWPWQGSTLHVRVWH